MSAGPWHAMRTAVEAGDTAAVVRLTGEFDEASRRAVAAELPGYLRQLGRPVWEDPRRTPLRVAGAGCIAGPAAAATWLARRGLVRFGRRDAGTADAVLAATAHRPDTWRAAMARQLTGRLRTIRRTPWELDSTNWEIVTSILVAQGQPLPATEEFVLGWLSWRCTAFPAADPHLRELAPALFDVDSAGEFLAEFWPVSTDPRHRDPSGALVAELFAVLARDDILDGCLRRFLRGGRPRDLGWFADLHARLAPTPTETGPRLRDYLRLLPAAPTAIADAALAHIRAVDAVAPITADAFAEAVRDLLSRPERRLAEAGLAWLDRTARAAGRGQLAIELAADAFGHPDGEVAARAARSAVAAAKRADPLTAELVRTAAVALPTVERAVIAEVYGAVASPPAAPPALPPVVARELPAPITAPAELRDAVMDYVFEGQSSFHWADMERLLAGLVVHGPAAVADLRTDLRRHAPGLLDGWHGEQFTGDSIMLVLHRLVRDPASAGRARPVRSRTDESESPAPLLVFRNRFAEAATAFGGPPLLATPTAATGHLDPEVFAARLAAWERAGAEPGRADLEQALLRLPLDSGPTRALAGLGSPAAALARTWIDGGRPVMDDPVCRLTRIKALPPGHWNHYHRNDMVKRLVATASVTSEHDAVARMGTLRAPRYAELTYWGCAHWWPSTLPSHRELTAAHLLNQAAFWPDDDFGQGATVRALAEATGRTGAASAAVLLFALASAASEHRAAALDALLSFAAHGDLPAAELGALAAPFSRSGDIVLSRLVPTLADAVRAGAPLWPFFTELIGALIPAPDAAVPHGFADLLAVAYEQAELHGIRGGIPALTAWRPRSRSTRAGTQAHRLRTLLAAP